MLIRAALPAESSTLSALALKAKAYWRYSPAQLDAWRDDLTITAESLAASPTWLAEIDSEIAGFYQLNGAGNSWALDHFWVDPAHMRRGVGKALLAHACGVAAQLGATHIDIDSDPNAEAFYFACGATRVGEIPAPIEGEPSRVRPQLRLATGAPRSMP